MNISTYFPPELLKRLEYDITLRKLGSGNLVVYVKGFLNSAIICNARQKILRLKTYDYSNYI